MGLGSFCSRKNDNLITLQPKSLRITGTQKGFVQYLEIYQSIQTNEDLNEVSYIFPTDNNLCIYSMKFQVGDETINAELRSNQQAEETYKEAKRIGRTAAKTETVSPGITAIKIGNVPKNKVVAITFECAQMSTLQNPKTILTKIPLQASEPDGSVTDLYNLPSLEINIDLTISHLQPISDVYTNCESEYVKSDDLNGKLTIKSALITDENILIMTEFTEPVQSQMIQANNATSISIIPEFESVKSETKEYVFLIDCSASMLGESMRKAKESLHLFLSKLPNGSYFNIIRFGTTYDKLFESSSEKVDSNIEKAKEYIDKMRANLGGTEMYSMLDSLFSNEIKIGFQRQIFVITDGEVYERQKVVQKVSENRGFNRIFAIGLGHGADAGFLEEITEMTHGKSDFVFNKDELSSKVAEQLDLSLIDSASGTEMHVEGNDSFETVPYPLPPLLPGVVSHFFVCSEKRVDDVMVTAKVGQNGAEIENVIGLKSSWINDDKKSPVYALFAWNQLKRIRDDVQKSVQLSLSSGVLCSYTNYIAVSSQAYVDPSKLEKEENKRKMESDDDDDDEDDEPPRRVMRKMRHKFARREICRCDDDEDEAVEDEEPKGMYYMASRPAIRRGCCRGRSRKMAKTSRRISSSDDDDDGDIEIPKPKMMPKEKKESKCRKEDVELDFEIEEEEEIMVMPKKAKCKKSIKKRKPMKSKPKMKRISSDDADAEEEEDVEISKPKMIPKKKVIESSDDEEKEEEEIMDIPKKAKCKRSIIKRKPMKPRARITISDKKEMSKCKESFEPDTKIEGVISPKMVMSSSSSDELGFESSSDDLCFAGSIDDRPTKKEEVVSHKMMSSSIDDEMEKKKTFSFEGGMKVANEIDESKVWKDEAEISDIIRLQSRDGFWDLPSLFVSKKCGGKMPEIDGLDLSDAPIIKKRVLSTVFTLAYLKKFMEASAGKWRFAKEKGIKWLTRIKSELNWEKIIEGIIPTITK